MILNIDIDNIIYTIMHVVKTIVDFNIYRTTFSLSTTLPWYLKKCAFIPKKYVPN